MSLVEIAHVTKHYGAELILSDVSFRLDRSDHAALVGTNGAGKSTVLRIIAGLEEPDAGKVIRSRGLRLAYLPQAPTFPEQTSLFDTMLEPFKDAINAHERLREIERSLGSDTEDREALDEYGRLQSLVEGTGYDYRQRIERVLTGLDLPVDLWDAPVSALSGGQRTRTNLARTLLVEADLLLLDEPTNHLDIAAVEWLEGYLRDLNRAFLIVAHDRYLLDRVTTRTLELSFQRVTNYDASYSKYVQLRSERAERQRVEFQSQQEQIARTEEFVRRYGAGQRSKEARGRQKRLDRLERVDRPRGERAVQLRLSHGRRTGDMALELRGLVVGYEDKPLVRLPEHVVIRRGDRIALVGPNGSGKTTLVRTLVGQIPPLQGTVRWGAGSSVGYYSQTLSQLQESRTVIEELQAVRPMSEADARTVLSRFLFTGDDPFKTINVLSGGERSRVALARLILEGPNVLVLDEPTNHLDIASRDALQSELSSFEGTLLFVSHDRYLIDALAGGLWVISQGVLQRFDGGYSAYAAGASRPYESLEERVTDSGRDTGPPIERVLRLEEEARAVANQLAELATTAPLGQLSELSQRYGSLIERIDEADWQWLQTVRKSSRASSV